MSLDVPPPFAHPVEAEFARILDFYGIPWEYEPRTFVLARDNRDRVTAGFQPRLLPAGSRPLRRTDHDAAESDQA